MMLLIGFIDYFPGDSGFIIPVFRKGQHSFIQKWIKGEVHHVDYNVDKETYQSTNEQLNKTTIIEDVFFKMQDKILIEDDKMYYAFKFNRDLISIGSKEEISNSVFFGLGTLKNNLGLHNELRRFINENNIDILSLKSKIDSKNTNNNKLAMEYAKYLFYSKNNQFSLIDLDESSELNQYFILNQSIITKLDPVFLKLRNEVNPYFHEVSKYITTNYADLIINHSNISKDNPIYLLARMEKLDFNQIKNYYNYTKITKSSPRLKQHRLEPKRLIPKGYGITGSLMHGSYGSLKDEQNKSSSDAYTNRIKQFFTIDKDLT